MSSKRVKLSVVAEKLPLSVVDFLLCLIAANHENRYIVVEALAGCGKTAMLTGLIRRINSKKAILLLSFTKAAITIARLRSNDSANVQTFDSLFFQTVKHGYVKEMQQEMNTDTFTYENFRDLSETLSEEDLRDFAGKAQSHYHMDDIGYIMVDEAQDTPPQAYRILETFRELGKTVIITGDRHQAIFGFMQTQSLFDVIPSSDKRLHFLRETRRCCPEVVTFLNDRFDLSMTSAYRSSLGPDAIDSVCVQAQYNATLGRLYTKFLFTMNTVLEVKVSDGESTEKFWDAVYYETSRVYSVSLEKARDIVKHRQSTLTTRHAKRSQLPREWRLPVFVFSTVHHFKGGECDVTVLAEDVDIHTLSDSKNDERMKYVAGSRARWGIVDLKSFSWQGHSAACVLFYRSFLKCRETTSSRGQGQAPRISSVSDLPVCVIPLITSPTLMPWMTEFRRVLANVSGSGSESSNHIYNVSSAVAMKVGTLADIFIKWRLETMARAHGVPHIHVCSAELLAKPLRDRKYAFMKRQGLIAPEIHNELRCIVTRMKLQAIFGRYLVVFHGWSVLRPLILRAASAKARLQTFVLCCNLQTLQRDKVELATKIRLRQLMENDPPFPGVLGKPDTWISLNLQESMPPNSVFFLRGNYDILIVDSDRTSHMIEIKTVRTVHPQHLLQTLLYTTVIHTSLNAKHMKWNTHLYETNRNHLYDVDPHPFLDMTEVLTELGLVFSSKILPQYYPNQLPLDSILALL